MDLQLIQVLFREFRQCFAFLSSFSFCLANRENVRVPRIGSPSATNLGDVDVGVSVPHEVDVGRGEVLADEVTAGAARLVGPLGVARAVGVADEREARLDAEAVGLDGAVRLAGQPVVELEKKLRSIIFMGRSKLLYSRV